MVTVIPPYNPDTSLRLNVHSHSATITMPSMLYLQFNCRELLEEIGHNAEWTFKGMLYRWLCKEYKAKVIHIFENEDSFMVKPQDNEGGFKFSIWWVEEKNKEDVLDLISKALDYVIYYDSEKESEETSQLREIFNFDFTEELPAVKDVAKKLKYDILDKQSVDFEYTYYNPFD